MNGGYEMFVLRQLTEAAEADRRHAGVSGRPSRLRGWLKHRQTQRRTPVTGGRRIARIPQQSTPAESVAPARSAR